MFYRINEQNNADIFEDSGERTTRIDANLYCVDSDTSTRYEHSQGVVLPVRDAESVGILDEDGNKNYCVNCGRFLPGAMITTKCNSCGSVIPRTCVGCHGKL